MPPTAPTAREVRAHIPPAARETSCRKALGMVARYFFWYALGLGLVSLPVHRPWPTQLLGTLLLGVMGAKFFELAHEALHLNFTGSRPLDRAIAYITLLPTLKPLSPTVYGHVQRHHRYTNIKGYDTQWSPRSSAEYAALSLARRLLERVYRSALGLGLYWSFEVVLRYHLPRGMVLSEAVQPRPAERASFARDRRLVYLYIAANLGGWPLLGTALGLSPLLTLLHGFVLPLLLSHWALGAVTYLQHTSEQIRWHESPRSWSFFEAQLRGTTDLVPANELMAVTFSKERPHAAHHVDMNVPAYGLRCAQSALDASYPGGLPKTPLRLRAFLDTVARCKVYDFASHQWRDFSGRATSEPHASEAGSEPSPTNPGGANNIRC